MDTAALERLETWRGTGGPPLWQDAWAATLPRAQHLFADPPAPYTPYYPQREVEGLVGLALGTYLLAAGQLVRADQVPLDQVGTLAAVPEGGTAWSVVDAWERRVADAGHVLDDAADPVARAWAWLRMDCSPAEPLPEAAQGDWTVRWGPDRMASLRAVVARAGL